MAYWYHMALLILVIIGSGDALLWVLLPSYQLNQCWLKQIFISFKEVYLEMRSEKCWVLKVLTHWRQDTYICVSKLTIIGSDNGLLPVQCQAIIWTNAGILLIRTLGSNFSEILSKIHTFSFTKMRLKMLSGKWQPFCPGGDELSL